MNTKTLGIISILMLASLLSACNDDPSKESNKEKTKAQNDDEIGVLEPYLEEPVLESHHNGERKFGLYYESVGQGKFQDCKTGKQYIVDISADNSLLHATYLALTQHSEQRLLIELVAEIETDNNDVSILQTQKLLRVVHLSSCP
ncbi:hypothetical protein [Kangiella koreensis]|uniref:NlpE C-terminal OB domain-containing protein n=1 Tax=Kangiella koreensis (strain DSM 16069 / JCM 12317 / KCTC 12182 / SW-125) TaxID=523791 RepID=C7RD05_KANKD|nr:hypothetical protein [Kangiella koreensis]ACV27147.1 hypothetical protein Kkor_1735 [Kangiella koreensis DSM 16069]